MAQESGRNGILDILKLGLTFKAIDMLFGDEETDLLIKETHENIVRAKSATEKKKDVKAEFFENKEVEK